MPLRGDNQAHLKKLDGERASAKAKNINSRIKVVGNFTLSEIIAIPKVIKP